MASYETYEIKKNALSKQMRETPRGVRLGKGTTNLYRQREGRKAEVNLDVRSFTEVIEVNEKGQYVDVEGMASYEKIADATVLHGVVPAVVPEFKSITAGGAISGVGIEASSFKFGLVHETMLEADVLLADGQVVKATSDNEHGDLFHAFPNSYGTLGYILRARMRTVPAAPFVRLSHTRHADLDRYFKQVQAQCDAGEADFMDGTIFSPKDLVLTTGHFSEKAPYQSDYTFENIYYKSLRERSEDYLTTRDFLWRWDTDWFWNSRLLGAENPIVRRLIGKKRLGSTFFRKAMEVSTRLKLGKALRIVNGPQKEVVIQDVDIPIENASAFVDFLDREVGVVPVWMCPIATPSHEARFPLYPLDPQKLYINFGIWGRSQSTKKDPRYVSKLLEQKTEELDGVKSLYSDSHYDQKTFWGIYDQDFYNRVKQKYDPNKRFKSLYDKAVSK